MVTNNFVWVLGTNFENKLINFRFFLIVILHQPILSSNKIIKTLQSGQNITKYQILLKSVHSFVEYSTDQTTDSQLYKATFLDTGDLKTDIYILHIK